MKATTIIPFGQSCENALKTQNTKLPHNKHYSFHRFLYKKKVLFCGLVKCIVVGGSCDTFSDTKKYVGKCLVLRFCGAHLKNRV